MIQRIGNIKTKMHSRNKIIIGWDIGGAHVKAVMLEANQATSVLPTVANVMQLACPLWRGLAQLEAAIVAVTQAWQLEKLYETNNIHHAITMTGELVDLFESRQQGVLEISQCLETLLVGNKSFFVMQPNEKTDCGYTFVPFEQVATHWQCIASANWFASAQWLTKHIENALLIDIGSTTTDFVLIQNHQVLMLKDTTDGLTDAARMQQQTLIYTGVVRTPLMALGHNIAFAGNITTLAAEHFATTADVYRLTNDLAPQDDLAETADGKDKSPVATAKRLARMVGYDINDATFADWQQLAQAFKAAQLARLQQVAKQHLQAVPWQGVVSIVGAGVGRFLVADIAKMCNVAYVDAAILINNSFNNDFNAENKTANQNASQTAQNASYLSATDVCFPAYAVAALLQNNIQNAI